MADLLQPIRPEDPRFARCGKLLLPQADPAPFGSAAAELYFAAEGKPRFYLMRVRRRPPVVAAMTAHQCVSQCLGSADACPWWLAVAPPGQSQKEISSASILLLKLLPGEGFKLHPGIWHAGPYFEGDSALFFNLELHNTNEVDHNCCGVDHPQPLALL